MMLMLPFAYVLHAPIVITAPIWAPLVEAGRPTQPAAESAPSQRPFENCCFVWIQDTDAGEIVAGASPTGKALKLR
jgi:hypothetical protein